MDNIGRIIGGGYGIGGGFVSQRKGEEAPQNAPAQEQVLPRNEEDLVSADKVLDFMANNTISVEAPVKGEYPELSADVQERIAASMPEFEAIYGAAANEFNPNIAQSITDLISIKNLPQELKYDLSIKDEI